MFLFIFLLKIITRLVLSYLEICPNYDKDKDVDVSDNSKIEVQRKEIFFKY